jgi:hypothetical protein
MKKAMTGLMVMVLAVVLAGCAQESRRASYNVSQAARNFEVNRRVVFYNGITGEYILTIEGLLSVTPDDRHSAWVSVIVKTGPAEYKKHYLGVSDNVTWFCEQIESVKADPFHYRVIFRPQTIVPNIELQTR